MLIFLKIVEINCDTCEHRRKNFRQMCFCPTYNILPKSNEIKTYTVFAQKKLKKQVTYYYIDFKGERASPRVEA